MRQDSAEFALYNTAPVRAPRFVASILFDVGSLYITSKSGISGVPGVVLQGMLEHPSAISQRIVPDEGRSEIGSFNFSIVDRAGALTDALKTKLDSGRGLRGRTVQLWVGYEGMAFASFQLFQTQVVTNATFSKGRYEVTCQDITREQRKEIFEAVSTTLRQSVTATDATIPVYDTTKFVAVAHGTSFSDAPSQTVYYIKLEDEVIRATGKTADTFTGCTRGVLNTRAVAHTVDAATAADRRTKVTEHIYLEMPAVKLAYAILTGVIHGTANTLPAHWHLGISPSLVRLPDFTGIGVDLWDPADDLKGFLVQFVGLSKIDGKRFLEKELYLPSRCFSPIYSDGGVGLRRMSRVIRDAVGVVRLTRKQLTQLGDLEHDLDGMHNHFRVNWAWDGKEFRRTSIFQDNHSIAVHGKAPIKAYDFKGIYGARHTDAYVLGLLDGLRDSYAAPPQRIKVSVVGSLNPIEVGDIVRLQEPNLRDFAGPPGGIDRAFLVLQKKIDFHTGDVDLDLFGSTVTSSVLSSTGETSALPDAFYTSQGVALSTVCTIVGNVVQPGTYSIGGGTTGTIYYHNADLTIAQGAIFQLAGNAQIRVRGYLTINGTIDGKGRGHAGVADAAGATVFPVGVTGFLGQTQGSDGMLLYEPSGGKVVIESRPAGRSAPAPNDSVPYFDIRYETTLVGLPSDLRGSSGGPGGKLIRNTTVEALGGTGGAGGSGLIIISRGMGFGASGSIDLSGANGTAGVLYTTDGNTYYSGGGAPGLSGGILVLLDGSGVSVPDLGGRYFGATGVPGYQATHTPAITTFLENRQRETHRTELKPFAGWPAPEVTHFVDSSNTSHRIQYIPAPRTAEADVDAPVLPVTSLVTSPGPGSIELTLGVPAGPGWIESRIYSSVDNNRANAVLVWQGRSDRPFEVLTASATRYYWATMFDTVENRESAFYPLGATAGVTGTAGSGGTSAITARLSNDSHTLAADASGNVAAYTGAEGIFEIKVGATDVSNATTFSILSNPQSLTVSLNTAANTPIGSQPAGFYRVTGGFGAGVDVATLVIRATYLGVNYDGIFSLSKAKAGTAGANGNDGLSTAPVMIYQRSATTPSVPSATVTYTFATGGISGLNNGWVATAPATNGNPLYMCQAVASAAAATDTIATGEWSAPIILAQDGSGGGGAAIIRNVTVSDSIPTSGTSEVTINTGSATFPSGGNIRITASNVSNPTDDSSSSSSNAVMRLKINGTTIKTTTVTFNALDSGPDLGEVLAWNDVIANSWSGSITVAVTRQRQTLPAGTLIQDYSFKLILEHFP